MTVIRFLFAGLPEVRPNLEHNSGTCVAATRLPAPVTCRKSPDRGFRVVATAALCRPFVTWVVPAADINKAMTLLIALSRPMSRAANSETPR